MSDDLERLNLEDVTPRPLPAGEFSTWLQNTRVTAPVKGGVDVPCGTCTACCTSSYYIHIAPDEVETLRRTPPQHTIPAPGLPAGNVLLGYDATGRCLMLENGQCSIYEHRPRTCRSYDCRIFAAAGIDTVNRPQIDRQFRRWQFGYHTAKARAEHAAVQAAAAFIRQHEDRFPRGAAPVGATQLALVAIDVFEVLANESDPAPRSDFERVEAICAKLDALDAARMSAR
jgi:Fe-S-cluster containining protein